MDRPYAALLFALAIAVQPVAAQEPRMLSVGELSAGPGTAVSGFLRIPATSRDTGTAIPVTLVHGARAGPVVAIVAGVHGSEYPPILALQELRRRLNPAELRGTVILVHCANPPSFFARTVYYGPVDWQNLNRVFPGSSDGKLSDRIAHKLVREVVARADILIDVHAGDANEALMSYSAIMLTGDSAKDARSRALGYALGFRRVFETLLPKPFPSPTRYLTRTAAAMGKVSLAIESGELGRRDGEYVLPVVEGLMNLLRTAEVVPGIAHRYTPIERFAENRSVVSPASGVIWPQVRLGQRVRQGDTVATVTDLWGTPAAAVLSPADGVIMYHAATPPIVTGETVAAVGIPLAK